PSTDEERLPGTMAAKYQQHPVELRRRNAVEQTSAQSPKCGDGATIHLAGCRPGGAFDRVQRGEEALVQEASDLASDNEIGHGVVDRLGSRPEPAQFRKFFTSLSNVVDEFQGVVDPRTCCREPVPLLLQR